jgi:membrane-associated phospholipid phosphatase
MLKKLKSDFAAEWCAVLAAALVDAMWSAHLNFHLQLSWHDALLPGAMLAALVLTRGFGLIRTALVTEYLCLSLATTYTLLVLSYLAMASAGPLFDDSLLAADRSLGFDWLSIYRHLLPHPVLMLAMNQVYDTLMLQGVYCAALLGAMRRLDDMRTLWRLIFCASIICCLGAMLFPALGPFKQFGLDAHGSFLPVMEKLLARRDLVFTPWQLTGVIGFPSLHTALALAYPYGMRHVRPIFWSLAAWNFLMLFTVPFFGGHYLSDMIAGAGVMLAAVAIVRLLSRKKHTAWTQSPAQEPA